MLRRRRDHLPLDEDWAGFERQARDAPDYASLVALFARLPETYRAALEMKLLLGYSGAEIARRLGLTESADSEVDPDDSAIEEVLEDPEELLDQA